MRRLLDRSAWRWWVLLAVAGVVAAATPAEAGDPWYRDVSGHWAEDYIRCLWEEGIADGSQEYVLTWAPGWGWSWEWQSRYYPDRSVDRAQFAMLLAKAFRLTPAPGRTGFLDVPTGYEAYPGKDAQPFIDAARLAGLVTGYAGGYFKPAQFITREEAVAILIRGLGLQEYSYSLPPAEISSLLSRFGDGHTVSVALRPEMATAIKLKIIVGYPDGTVQPQNNMTRAEAAAIVFRSCLLVLTASPNPFSPDGDGADDCTLVTVLTLRNRNVRAWEVNVTDYGGHILRHLGQGTGQPPGVLIWTGIDNHGNVLPDGTYYLGGQVTDTRNQVHSAAMHPVRLEQRRLWGNLQPVVVRPGQTIGVTAGTTGRALWVEARPSPLPPFLLTALSPSGPSQSWEGTFTVPLDAPDGAREVVLTAGYAQVQRGIRLAYTVYQPLPLVAWVEPDPAPSGSTASLWAEVGFPATSVTAAIDGLPNLALQPATGQVGRWSAQFTVLPDWPAGQKVALVTGLMPGRSRTVEAAFGVERCELPDLLFYLSD